MVNTNLKKLSEEGGFAQYPFSVHFCTFFLNAFFFSFPFCTSISLLTEPSHTGHKFFEKNSLYRGPALFLKYHSHRSCTKFLSACKYT